MINEPMNNQPETIEKTIELLSSLPTIGKKTALRLTYYLIKQPETFIQNLAEALLDLKKKIRYCSICFNFSETDPCPICSSENRDKSVICVVEQPDDVIAIEKTNEFKGLYHILHGTISHLDGITISKLKINELIERAKSAKEIIFALNPSVEGEITTQYIAQLLKPLKIKLTRLARGIPFGTELQFADDATISNALENRVSIY